MARNIPLQLIRTSRANLNSNASSNNLLQGEPYLITDENTLAIGTGINTSQTLAKEIATCTFTNLPSSNSVIPYKDIYCVTNVGNPCSYWYSTGTSWHPVSSPILVHRMSADIIDTGTVNETLLDQFLLPPAILRNRSELKLWIRMTKTPHTLANTTTVRLGTSGTVADTFVASLYSSTTNRQMSTIVSLTVISPTTIRATTIVATASPTIVTNPFGVSNNVPYSDITIPNISNSLYISLGNISGTLGESATFDTFTAELFV